MESPEQVDDLRLPDEQSSHVERRRSVCRAWPDWLMDEWMQQQQQLLEYLHPTYAPKDSEKAVCYDPSIWLSTGGGSFVLGAADVPTVVIEPEDHFSGRGFPFGEETVLPRAWPDWLMDEWMQQQQQLLEYLHPAYAPQDSEKAVCYDPSIWLSTGWGSIVLGATDVPTVVMEPGDHFSGLGFPERRTCLHGESGAGGRSQSAGRAELPCGEETVHLQGLARLVDG
ncbi:unnamed protein product [Protopolystoma xenopodis]|uniref:Uncharacterized protein n=1 Tax=Protopolystoma xenopodis TaxID=117903 RepID=A0A3S5CP65_9PLAT|nr:unnamed protein product [Protopolystoma xenopodis]